LSFLALLLLACYYPMLWMTGKIIVTSDDMAHGFFAPLVALYIVWDKRRMLFQPSSQPSLWGLAFLSLAACLAVFSTLAASSTFSRIAFLISLAGCLLLVGGWQTFRQFLFPLSLLIFTFPIPDVLYGQLTQPLLLLATQLSENIYEFLGFSVIREGNIIRLTHMTLSVVEACSGLRSLITLIFFCLVYSWFFESRNWVRAVVVLFSVPTAIAVNALRITATGVLGKYNVAWTVGTYHESLGWAAVCLGFLIVFLAHTLIRRVLLAASLRASALSGMVL